MYISLERFCYRVKGVGVGVFFFILEVGEIGEGVWGG